MNLLDLSRHPLAYLATPYTKYVGGPEEAFVAAARVAGGCVARGLRNIYSPITHTHPLAVFGELDPLDLTLWLEFDAVMMQKSDALVVAMLLGWETSFGIRHEMQVFIEADKPVYFLDPVEFVVVAATADERAQLRKASAA